MTTFTSYLLTFAWEVEDGFVGICIVLLLLFAFLKDGKRKRREKQAKEEIERRERVFFRSVEEERIRRGLK